MMRIAPTMRTTVTFEREFDPATDGKAAEPDAPAAAWRNRRSATWEASTMPASRRAAGEPGTYGARVAVINAGETPEGDRRHLLRIVLDVADSAGAEAIRIAGEVMDMDPARGEPHREVVPLKNAADNVIDRMPDRWPLGRRLTGVSTRLRVDDGTETEAAAWQIDGGSWVALPFERVAGMIVTTRETVLDPMRDGVCDVRIVRDSVAGVGAGPASSEMSDRRPRIRRFEADDAGFVLEASDGADTWRFEAHGIEPAGPAADAGSGPTRALRECFVRVHSAG